jgi:hypothetical protein
VWFATLNESPIEGSQPRITATDGCQGWHPESADAVLACASVGAQLAAIDIAISDSWRRRNARRRFAGPAARGEAELDCWKSLTNSSGERSQRRCAAALGCNPVASA